MRNPCLRTQRHGVDPAGNDLVRSLLGYDPGVSGDSKLVGASSLYVRTGTTWSQQATLPLLPHPEAVDLEEPWDVAVDVAGQVFVTGHDSSNAFRITPGGLTSEIINNTGDGAGNAFVTATGIAVDDAGKLINPLLAEGQVHGGIAQGVAQALYEIMLYDEDGIPLTVNFSDYPVISATELPSFELVHLETPTWVNELGAKGVGESGTIGAIPAVYNAVINALSHLGGKHLETPLTPERIWRSLSS